MYGYYFDPTYILVIIGALLCMAASSRVNSTYHKYARVRARSGMTGAEAAQRILQMSGIHDVQIQHKEGYLPLKLRSALVPAANLGSKLGLPIVILGLILGIGLELPGGGYFSLAEIGVWIFALAVLFQIITLPVEFNASGRALKLLSSCGIMNEDETDDCRRVLGAAALTYVAAAASAILQLLRLLILSGGRRRRDD